MLTGKVMFVIIQEIVIMLKYTAMLAQGGGGGGEGEGECATRKVGWGCAAHFPKPLP